MTVLAIACLIGGAVIAGALTGESAHKIREVKTRKKEMKAAVLENKKEKKNEKAD